MRKLVSSVALILFLSSAFCQTKTEKPEMPQLNTWERRYFTKPLNNPFIFYCIFGDFSADLKISPEYRTLGLPAGCELMKYGPKTHPEVVKSFLQGYLWKTLKSDDSTLASKIDNSTECFVLRGELKDTSNLNYLRDIVGIITYLLDHGGVSVYDPQAFRFFGKEDWMENIYKPNGSVPRNHVLIIYSEENGLKWYHTRGMRKFGRPDLSIHNVAPQYEEAIYDLFNRFIEYQAFGGIIDNKQEIKMKSLPAGMWCENRGDFEDPDFNNKHVEIFWK